MDADMDTTYAVKWHTPNSPVNRNATVTIIKGYTTLADIPKIIACARTGNPADASKVIIDQITRLDG